MQLWNPGDKSEAMCPKCRARRSTTFTVRDVRLEDRRVTAKDVLIAVCDVCDTTVSVPAQSTPLLKEAIEKAPAMVRARINRRLEDAVRLIAHQYGAVESDVRPLLLKYYLRLLQRDAGLVRRVALLAHSKLVEGKKTARFEVRLAEPALAAAIEDVLDHRAPRRAAELEELAAFA